MEMKFLALHLPLVASFYTAAFTKSKKRDNHRIKYCSVRITDGIGTRYSASLSEMQWTLSPSETDIQVQNVAVGSIAAYLFSLRADLCPLLPQ
jgi:hypothetical protein